MTTFKQAKEKGQPWPQGPDDMCPSKVHNQYLYGGGRTFKLKLLLGNISVAWLAGTVYLDKYLTKNRHMVKQNYFLERLCLNSVRYMWPVFFVLWFGLPHSQWLYWKILDLAVGAKPLTRDPRPNWKPDEGILAKLEQ